MNDQRVIMCKKTRNENKKNPNEQETLPVDCFCWAIVITNMF